MFLHEISIRKERERERTVTPNAQNDTRHINLSQSKPTLEDNRSTFFLGTMARISWGALVIAEPCIGRGTRNSSFMPPLI